MATVTYAYTPGQAVFVVKPETFGVGKATIVSVQITADPLSTKYVVQYLTSTRPQAVVDETDIFPDVDAALAAFKLLVM